MITLRTFLIVFRVAPRSAMTALWQRVLGRKVRARNMLFSAAQRSSEYYPGWVAFVEPRKIEAYCRTAVCQKPLPPIIAIVFGGGASLKAARETVTSLKSAFGDKTIICSDIYGSGDRLDCVEPRTGRLSDLFAVAELSDPNSMLLPLMAGDKVAPAIGRAVSVALAESVEPEIIYWDEDRLNCGKRVDPWLKPEWDELLFLARDFITGSSLLKTSALLRTSTDKDRPFTPDGVSAAVISLVSRARGNPSVRHVPLILSHRSLSSNFGSGLRRKESIQSAWHEPVELEEISGAWSALRPRFATSAPLPKVSIIVPTRNGRDLLERCMSGIARLNYPAPLELIIVDNDSDESSAIEYLSLLKSRGAAVILHRGPFNFSAINNRAAKVASGELLCFLNNDVEMHDDCWLEIMVRHAIRRGIGAVGALLKYPDGTVQHAGVCVGMGNAAGHIYRGIRVEATGHRDMHRLTREVSAVTAACMVVRRDRFFEVGGFDEKALKVAFNDVDFCLKLLQRGYKNVFAGEACLTHHESKSRGSDFSEDNRERYFQELAHLQDRWNTKEFVDPYGHPLAMRSSERFVLGP